MARVLLLFGGRSAEHEVSCASAVSIHDALISAGHRVIAVGIDRTGDWFVADTNMRPFRAEGRPTSMHVPSGRLRSGSDEFGVDVVFPVIHGPSGEDGTLQGLFETCSLPYVGSGVRGSAVATDKDLSKQLAETSGISTAPWKAIQRSVWDDDPTRTLSAIADSLRFPLFVKPSSQGSSVGVQRVDSDEGMKDAIVDAFRYGDKVVVEQAIDGREIEVAVLDGPKASDPGEVVVLSGWYDYEAKYADDTSRFEAPAELSAHDAATVRGLAERVFRLLELEGLARIDFFREASSGRFFFNEANTMPGFTSISGFPKMWEASGIAYPALCDHLVQAAIELHERRSRFATR
ncbi:MAG: D-alanine--D-alanine ligase family protein [Acidimicrobiia bacterium]